MNRLKNALKKLRSTIRWMYSKWTRFIWILNCFYLNIPDQNDLFCRNNIHAKLLGKSNYQSWSVSQTIWYRVSITDHPIQAVIHSTVEKSRLRISIFWIQPGPFQTVDVVFIVFQSTVRRSVRHQLPTDNKIFNSRKKWPSQCVPKNVCFQFLNFKRRSLCKRSLNANVFFSTKSS